MEEEKKLTRITVDLPADFAKEVKVFCAMHEINMRTVVIESLKNHIKDFNGPTSPIAGRTKKTSSSTL